MVDAAQLSPKKEHENCFLQAKEKKNNALGQFEDTLPFVNTNYKTFVYRMNEAKKISGLADDLNIVDIENLRSQLYERNWAQLDDENSPLRKLLALKSFRPVVSPGEAGPSEDDNLIDCNQLRIFALLACAGSRHDKAHGLFEIIKGGDIYQYPEITAFEKSYPVVMKAMCNFVTVDIIEAAGFEMKYS